MHLPLDNTTSGLIGKDEIEKMRPEVCLINTSRGGIIDETGLYDALIQNEISGAAIDVFENEPYYGNLINCDNAILTAHMGSMTLDCRSRMELEACEEACRFLAGDDLLFPALAALMSRAMKGSALVIGGAGFLGSHVADALTESGYEVCIYDRVQSQYLRNNQRMILGSIEDEASLLSAMSGVDYVFHLAAIADIASCNKNPMAAIESNILGSARVFESCYKSKVQKIIFASSVYVYSDSGGFYRATKQASETLL